MSAVLNLPDVNYNIPVESSSGEELSKETIDLLCFIYLLQEGGSVRRDSLFRQGKETEVWQELQRSLNNKLVDFSTSSAEMETQEVTKHTSVSDMNPFTFLGKSFFALFFTGPKKQEMLKDARDSISNAYKGFWQGVKEGKALEVTLFAITIFSGGTAPPVIWACGLVEMGTGLTSLFTDEKTTDMTFTITQNNQNKFELDQMGNFTIMVLRQNIDGQLTIYQQASNTALTEFDTEGKAVSQITQIATHLIQVLIVIVKKANLRMQ